MLHQYALEILLTLSLPRLHLFETQANSRLARSCRLKVNQSQYPNTCTHPTAYPNSVTCRHALSTCYAFVSSIGMLLNMLHSLSPAEIHSHNSAETQCSQGLTRKTIYNGVRGAVVRVNDDRSVCTCCSVLVL